MALEHAAWHAVAELNGKYNQRRVFTLDGGILGRILAMPHRSLLSVASYLCGGALVILLCVTLFSNELEIDVVGNE